MSLSDNDTHSKSFEDEVLSDSDISDSTFSVSDYAPSDVDFCDFDPIVEVIETGADTDLDIEKMIEVEEKAQAAIPPDFVDPTKQVVNTTLQRFPRRFHVSQAALYLTFLNDANAPKKANAYVKGLEPTGMPIFPAPGNTLRLDTLKSISDVLNPILNTYLRSMRADPKVAIYEGESFISPDPSISMFGIQSYSVFDKAIELVNQDFDLIVCFGLKALKRLSSFEPKINAPVVCITAFTSNSNRSEFGRVSTIVNAPSGDFAATYGEVHKAVIMNFKDGIQLHYLEMPDVHFSEFLSSGKVESLYPPIRSHLAQYPLSAQMYYFAEAASTPYSLPDGTFLSATPLYFKSVGPQTYSTFDIKLIEPKSFGRNLKIAGTTFLVTPCKSVHLPRPPVVARLTIDRLGLYLELHNQMSPPHKYLVKLFDDGVNKIHSWTPIYERLSSLVNRDVIVVEGYKDGDTISFLDLEKKTGSNYNDGVALMSNLRNYFGSNCKILFKSGTSDVETQVLSFQFHTWSYYERSMLEKGSSYIIKMVHLQGDQIYFAVPNMTVFNVGYVSNIYNQSIMIKNKSKDKTAISRFDLVVLKDDSKGHLLFDDRITHKEKLNYIRNSPRITHSIPDETESFVDAHTQLGYDQYIMKYRTPLSEETGDTRLNEKASLQLRNATVLRLKTGKKKITCFIVVFKDNDSTVPYSIRPRTFMVPPLVNRVFLRSVLNNTFMSSLSFEHIKKKTTEERLSRVFPVSYALFKKNMMNDGALTFAPYEEVDRYLKYFVYTLVDPICTGKNFLSAMGKFVARNMVQATNCSEHVLHNLYNVMSRLRKLEVNQNFEGQRSENVYVDMHEKSPRHRILDIKGMMDKMTTYLTATQKIEVIQKLKANPSLLPDGYHCVDIPFLLKTDDDVVDIVRTCIIRAELILKPKYAHITKNATRDTLELKDVYFNYFQ